ncbi:hypothetical protein [Thermococcus sp.]|uniref:hypothetical protein n=1 Tax=Thermococcus sp. TaxID=35749 RepID=UPI0026357541|nr:hypothetical protein [Thermococcus sp.]
MSTPKRQITRLKDFVRCLEGAKREYKTKWALYENDIIDQFEHISQLLFSENPPVEEIVDIIKNASRDQRNALLYSSRLLPKVRRAKEVEANVN